MVFCHLAVWGAPESCVLSIAVYWFMLVRLIATYVIHSAKNTTNVGQPEHDHPSKMKLWSIIIRTTHVS